MASTSPPEPRVPAPRWAPRSEDGAIRPHGCTLPPPPPGCRYVPVPWLGVVVADDSLRKRVDRNFHAPMMLLALAVLPLLVLDYLYIREGGEDGPTRGWLWWLVITGLTVIWVAFTVEFIIKITIAEDRWEYLRRNWLDLIIIVIPLLRPLRVASVARTTRVFRLRGVGFKLARYVFTFFIGMEASNRLMNRMGLQPRKPRTNPDEMTRHQLTSELKRLRRLSEDWSIWYAQQQRYLDAHHLHPLSGDPPIEEADPADVDVAARQP